jgi:putative aldouronate transport system permease protein
MIRTALYSDQGGNNMSELNTTSAKISSRSVGKNQLDRQVLAVIGYISLSILAFLCILPFILILSSSLTEESTIVKEGFQIFPKMFSTEAYSILFKYPDEMLKAYAVTITVTIIGTLSGLFLTSITAYCLSRKHFKWRNHFSFFFFFTTLFNGGLVPWYLMIANYLHMKDTLLVLIIPLLLNVFYIIVMKSFMSNIPEAITESAKIDGAGDFLIFARLIVPLSKPALATIGLFIALAYWNDWYNALLFVSKSELMPLQYYLYKMLGNMDGMRKAMMGSGAVITTSLPTESLKMAMTIVATGPILIAYPFIQKYFVQGLTIGAVKG